MRRLVLLVLPLLTAGCIAANRPPALLADSNWRLIAIDGQPAALLDQAGIAFANETVSASVGCNRMGGAYRVERQRLFAGPLVQTECIAKARYGARNRRCRRCSRAPRRSTFQPSA